MTRNLEHLIQGLTEDSSRMGVDSVTAMSAILEAIPDRTAFSRALLSTARQVFVANHGAILSLYRPTGKWYVEASFGLDPDSIEELKNVSRTVVRRVVESGQNVRVGDARNDQLTKDSPSIQKFNIYSVICAPVLDSRGVSGVIYLANSCVPFAFTERAHEDLGRFAGFAALAIRRCEEFITLTGPLAVPSAHGDEASPGFFHFRDRGMGAIMEFLGKIAPLEVPILLTGETGTGKDFLARWIHGHSSRKKAPFTHVDCTSIPEEVFESVLFGIERNVATNVGFREGRLKLAEGGTVFLNEIGELPMPIQAKLLRAIGDKEVDRVGGQSPVGLDVRFVLATNRNLSGMTKTGGFREDLYFRINAYETRIPPLRDRREDIEPLVVHLVENKCREFGRPVPKIPTQAMARLIRSPWVGNIRELSNVIERALVLTHGEELVLDRAEVDGTEDLSNHVSVRPGDGLEDLLRRFEAQTIGVTLRASGWNISQAASKLRVPEATLRFRMKRSGVKPPERFR